MLTAVGSVLSQLFFVFCFRGFNDAINGFSDDGWTVLGCDGSEDVVVAVNSSKNVGSNSSVAMPSGILCAKAFMLLQVDFSDGWLRISLCNLLLIVYSWLYDLCTECFSSIAGSILEGAQI